MTSGILLSGSSRSRRASTLAVWAFGGAIVIALSLLAIPGVRRESKDIDTRLCRQELARILAAKTKYALDHHLEKGAVIDMKQLLETDSLLRTTPVCPSGGVYHINPVGTDPACSFGGDHNIAFAPAPAPDPKTGLVPYVQ